ncbi:MAG: hypothetical protein IIA09_18685, partial [Proteobacteria bacterium]|nr:hypothetical protein [Pseudomonadota bacterium]
MWKLISVLAFFTLAACGGKPAGDAAPADANSKPEFSVSESGVKTKHVEGFGGVIAESYADSREWWPDEELPNEDAPNII